MSEHAQGPGWWKASDGRWYPPELADPPPTNPPGAVPLAKPGDSLPPPGGPPGPQGPPPVYGQGYAPTYGAGYGTPYAPQRRTEPMAVASLVVACVAIPIGCLCGVGFLASPVAVALGYTGRRRIAESGGTLDGDGLAIAGMIVGGVGCALLVAWIGLFFFWGGLAAFSAN